jgi:hypothetical protein
MSPLILDDAKLGGEWLSVSFCTCLFNSTLTRPTGAVAYPGIFFGAEGYTRDLFGGEGFNKFS